MSFMLLLKVMVLMLREYKMVFLFIRWGLFRFLFLVDRMIYILYRFMFIARRFVLFSGEFCKENKERMKVNLVEI